MRPNLSKFLALASSMLGACGGAPPPKAAAPDPVVAQTAPRRGLQIQLATIYVDDQDKALAFYTDVLGLEEKDDVSNGGYRWLTVTAPDDADGTALQLALDSDPAAKAYQEAMFAQGQPAVMLFTDDIDADYARIQAAGAAFTMPPTEVMPGSTIATLEDTCGNLIQITELVP